MLMGNTPQSGNCCENFLSSKEYTNPHSNFGDNSISDDGGDFWGKHLSYGKSTYMNGKSQPPLFCPMSRHAIELGNKINVEDEWEDDGRLMV